MSGCQALECITMHPMAPFSFANENYNLLEQTIAIELIENVW